ncbi:Peptidoglycan-binding domain 1 protein [Catenulispora acidiphila DSM 44928]|uniref:Peptidoglycan-binding domain 1 protein n=2 Tax=Catenulispora TaxID=414878 RepID=C7QCU8_CATAD|nr:Peptidoglycan-binding domain 1 protein [Catenulispora acidiphila DSM 44928]
MMSPYGMPLSDGGPEGTGGSGNQGGQGGYGGYGGHGPGDGDPGDSGRRRKTLIASALAVVAVVGIGGAVASMNSGSHKPDTASLAGAGASESSSSTPGDGSAVIANGGGKPDGDDMAAASTNGAQGANVPGNPTSTGTPTGGHTGPSTSPGSPSTSHPATSTHPGSTASSHPGTPVVSNPPPSAAKPSAPATTVTVSVPSTDCTYMDLPASKMPQIKQGSTNVNAVKQVQCLLKKSELGIKPLAIDGQWGSDTQSAMTAFQKCNNAPTVHSPGGTPPYPKLSVDGVAGPQTWADLYFWDNQYFNGTSYYCNGTR